MNYFTEIFTRIKHGYYTFDKARKLISRFQVYSQSRENLNNEKENMKRILLQNLHDMLNKDYMLSETEYSNITYKKVYILNINLGKYSKVAFNPPLEI